MKEVFVCHNDSEFNRIQERLLAEGNTWYSKDGKIYNKPLDIKKMKNQWFDGKKFAYPTYVKKSYVKNQIDKIVWGLYTPGIFTGYLIHNEVDKTKVTFNFNEEYTEL